MRKKVVVMTVIVIFFSFMFSSIDNLLTDNNQLSNIVYAEEDDTSIERDSKKYEAYRFELMTHADEAWYQWGKKTGNAIVTAIKDFLWSINMVLSQLVMMIVYQLFSLDIVNLTKDSVTSIASATAGSMITNFLYFSMAIASAGIVVRAYIKQDWSGFFKILTLIIISLALLFSIKTEKFNYVDLIDTVSIGFENAILKANPTLSDRSGTIDLEDADIDDADSMRDIAVMIENKVFDSVIYKPYLLLQYGDVDEEKIHDEGVDAGASYENGETRITKYLNADPYTRKGIDKRKDIAEEELDDLGNKNIFAGNGFTSASYILSSIVSTIIQGLVFFFLAMMRVLMQFALILALICLPIVLVMSLIPTLETLLASYMKLIMKIVMFKGILLFFILIATSFISLSYSITDASNNIFYRMFVQILFSVAVIFIYMKREFAFSMFEGANATVNDIGGGKFNPNFIPSRKNNHQRNSLKDNDEVSNEAVSANGMGRRQSIQNSNVTDINKRSEERSAKPSMKSKVSPVFSKAKQKMSNAKNHVASVQRGDIPNHKDPYNSEENQDFTDSPYHQTPTGTDENVYKSNDDNASNRQTHFKTGDIDQLNADKVNVAPERNVSKSTNANDVVGKSSNVSADNGIKHHSSGRPMSSTVDKNQTKPSDHRTPNHREPKSSYDEPPVRDIKEKHSVDHSVKDEKPITRGQTQHQANSKDVRDNPYNTMKSYPLQSESEQKSRSPYKSTDFYKGVGDDDYRGVREKRNNLGDRKYD